LAARKLEAVLITLDTSAVLASIDGTDPAHDRVVDTLARARGPLVLPVAILSEVAYLVEQNFGTHILEEFIRAIAEQQFILDCGEQDFARIHALVVRYRDLPLGLSDAAVITCGERNGGLIATLDYRHFGVVAGEGTIRIVPEIF
jgi:predicted nucleic acid-binding protein